MEIEQKRIHPVRVDHSQDPNEEPPFTVVVMGPPKVLFLS